MGCYHSGWAAAWVGGSHVNASLLWVFGPRPGNTVLGTWVPVGFEPSSTEPCVEDRIQLHVAVFYATPGLRPRHTTVAGANHNMLLNSTYAPLDIPETNILSYTFPPGQTPSDKPIWIDAKNPSHSLSPRQALVWIKRLGSLLDYLSIPKGEAVMILTPNHIFVPVAYLGITGAGRVFSGANPVYTATEVEYQIRNTGTRLILTHPSLAQTAVEAGRRAGIQKDRIYLFSDHECESSGGLRDWRSVPVDPNYTWDPVGSASKTALATINYSSGTTGLPKGVCVSHFNIVANSEQTIFMRDLETSPQDERWLGFLPLYHAYGTS